MRLKPGVKLTGLTPQMALAALIVWRTYEERGGECTITSANDSTHSAHSLHYKGNALDFRTHDFVGDRHELTLAIREALGENFDVLLESEGGANEHIHVEYDPT